MDSSVEIVLARHGETEWSSSGRHTSTTDLPLTAEGREQARLLAGRLAQRFAGLEFASVFTSPRRRARETCALAGFDQAVVVEDLAEWDYGELEGRTTAEIRHDVGDWTIFSHGASGGESVDQVSARADRVIDVARHADGPVLLFSHGHFLRVLGARWIGYPAAEGARLALDTATISALGHEREARVLWAWNA